MQTPMNSAAQQVAAAQSIISDLNQQIQELQRAMDRQQGVIDVLLPLSVWDAEPVEEPEEPEEPVEEE